MSKLWEVGVSISIVDKCVHLKRREINSSSIWTGRSAPFLTKISVFGDEIHAFETEVKGALEHTRPLRVPISCLHDLYFLFPLSPRPLQWSVHSTCLGVESREESQAALAPSFIEVISVASVFADALTVMTRESRGCWNLQI
jgi:hypothetical protein